MIRAEKERKIAEGTYGIEFGYEVKEADGRTRYYGVSTWDDTETKPKVRIALNGGGRREKDIKVGLTDD